MSQKVEETFFGAFLDKSLDMLQNLKPPAESLDNITSRHGAKAFTDNEGLHLTPEMIADHSDFAVDHTDATPFDNTVPGLEGVMGDLRLTAIEAKVDRVLQILLTPKKRGRPVGTTGIKKRKSKKPKLAKSTYVKKKIKR